MSPRRNRPTAVVATGPAGRPRTKKSSARLRGPEIGKTAATRPRMAKFRANAGRPQNFPRRTPRSCEIGKSARTFGGEIQLPPAQNCQIVPYTASPFTHAARHAASGRRPRRRGSQPRPQTGAAVARAVDRRHHAQRHGRDQAHAQPRPQAGAAVRAVDCRYQAHAHAGGGDDLVAHDPADARVTDDGGAGRRGCLVRARAARARVRARAERGRAPALATARRGGLAAACEACLLPWRSSRRCATRRTP